MSDTGTPAEGKLDSLLSELVLLAEGLFASIGLHFIRAKDAATRLTTDDLRKGRRLPTPQTHFVLMVGVFILCMTLDTGAFLRPTKLLPKVWQSVVRMKSLDDILLKTLPLIFFVAVLASVLGRRIGNRARNGVYDVVAYQLGWLSGSAILVGIFGALAPLFFARGWADPEFPPTLRALRFFQVLVALAFVAFIVFCVVRSWHFSKSYINEDSRAFPVVMLMALPICMTGAVAAASVFDPPVLSIRFSPFQSDASNGDLKVGVTIENRSDKPVYVHRVVMVTNAGCKSALTVMRGDDDGKINGWNRGLAREAAAVDEDLRPLSVKVNWFVESREPYVEIGPSQMHELVMSAHRGTSGETWATLWQDCQCQVWAQTVGAGVARSGWAPCASSD